MAWSSLNRQELMSALQAVKPGLASRELIEQSTNFAFVDGSVATFNGEVAVIHPLPGIGDLTGVVDAPSLYGLLEKLTHEKLRICVEGSELLMSSGGVKAGLTLESDVRLPLDEVKKEGCKWVKAPENLMKAFKFVLPACSKDLSIPILTCVHCDLSVGMVEASDTIRFCRHVLGGGSEKGKSFLLPAHSVGQLTGYEFVELVVVDSWVHFRTKEGTEVSCRRAAGEYPDTGIFNFTGASIDLPARLPEALDRAHVFADRAYELSEEVEIQLGNGQFSLHSTGDSGWVKEKIKSSYKGEPLKFVTHPTFLADASRHGSKVFLGEDKLRFEGTDWVYVVALM